jgi:hypothetical protein
MNHLKLFEEYGGKYQEKIAPPGFTDYISYNKAIWSIKDVIPMSSKPMSWEDIPSIDLDDINDDTLKLLFKLPVYNVTDLNEVFNRGNEDEDIKSMGEIDPYSELYSGNITSSNYIFFEDLKIPYQMFLIRFLVNDIDCGLLVDTQGFNYMRYVGIIKEFGDMYDYYKKDLELRDSPPKS